MVPDIGQSLGTKGAPQTAQRYSLHQQAKRCPKRLDIQSRKRLSSSSNLEGNPVPQRHCGPGPLAPQPGLNSDRARAPYSSAHDDRIIRGRQSDLSTCFHSKKGMEE